MYENYFIDWDVRPEFQTEYISLWPNWLGKVKLHLLDEVIESEWQRFNILIESISKNFKVGLISFPVETISFPRTIKNTFSSYSASMNKDASLFAKYILPELDCLITEEWDYTYILWHKNNGAVEVLSPYISSSKLHHFSDKRYG